MPRPLSSFDTTGYTMRMTGNSMGPITIAHPDKIIFCLCNSGDYPLEARPRLLALAMRIISACSILDTYIARSFATMLGVNADPAMAMYDSLGSVNLQHTTLKAAAGAVLPETQYELLVALLALYKKRTKLRHRVAHHLWGYSSAVSDGILLMDPKDYSENLDAIDLNKISVYQETDFTDAIASIEALCHYFHDFYFLVGPHKWRADEILSRLLGVPQIQSELSRLFPESQTPQQAQPQQQPPPNPTGTQ